MSFKLFSRLPTMSKSTNVQLLSEFDFCVLRFKIAKLLRTSHRRILSIDVMDDGKIVAHTSFIIPVEFQNVKEIDDDFKHFYPDVVVPDIFTATDGSHRSIKREESQLVPLVLN
ncbi:hypothetical protein [Sulfurospirillum oryzae]|uniref:hypothetical protein n=1 Tax=Sulfurospirillum oryzae TaxID=2976535 RepID=UPI0021E8A6E6|nr:hypothetical protein [Sulfurospirillum oryzae]